MFRGHYYNHYSYERFLDIIKKDESLLGLGSKLDFELTEARLREVTLAIATTNHIHFMPAELYDAFLPDAVKDELNKANEITSLIEQIAERWLSKSIRNELIDKLTKLLPDQDQITDGFHSSQLIYEIENKLKNIRNIHFHGTTRSHIDFINNKMKRNFSAAELAHNIRCKEAHSFKNHFLQNFFNFFLLPIVYGCMIGKELFSRSVGMSKLLNYFSEKFEPFTEWNLPTFSLGQPYYRSGMFDLESIVWGFGRNNYKINGATLFLAPINYLMRTLGKIIGTLIGAVVACVIFPFAFIKSFVDYIRENNKGDYSRKIAEHSETISKFDQAELCKVFDLIDIGAIEELYRKLITTFPSLEEKFFDRIASRLSAIDSDESNFILGSLYKDKHMDNNALTCFSRINSLDENYIALMFDCGNHAYVSKNYILAEVFFQKILDSTTTNPVEGGMQKDSILLLKIAKAASANVDLTYNGGKCEWVMTDKETLKQARALSEKQSAASTNRLTSSASPRLFSSTSAPSNGLDASVPNVHLGNKHV